uniref:Uncharacterized protein n=1 Tax=Ciona savignyi TaxID=51511 RepID=H2YY66_CIOSA
MGKSVHTENCWTGTPCVQQVRARWTNWENWSRCPHVRCGVRGNNQNRRRRCQGGSPGQQGCNGPDFEVRDCASSSCIPAGWFNWGSWGSCSLRKRERNCNGGIPEKNNNCQGSAFEYSNCESPSPNRLQWSRWSDFAESCGPTLRMIMRLCSGSGCPGEN